MSALAQCAQADVPAGCVVRGLRQELVVSEEQIYSLISVGEAQRHVGSTNYNEKSSRSHTIFQMVRSPCVCMMHPPA